MDGEEDEGYYDIRGEEDTPNVGSSVVDSSTTPVVTSPAAAAEAGSSSSSSSSSWLPILESSNQLVLYNPYSHALTITPTFLPPVLVSSTVRGNGGSRGHGARENEEEEGDGQSGSNGNGNGVLTTRTIGNDRYRDENGEEGGDDDDLPVLHGRCPLCSRPFSTRAPLAEEEDHTDDEEGGRGILHGNGGLSRGTGMTRGGAAALSLRRASNYFQLLETSFEAQKRRVPAPPLLSAPSAPATIASPSSPSSPFISVVPSPSSEVVDGIGTPHYTTNSTNTSSTTVGYGKGKAASSIPSRAVRGGGGRGAAAEQQQE
ncbi:hypothetical protein FRC17_007928 [Serendipita sp. 399]|nr:hypothetical protein FRC17_007928 [Serendipita sp. 399]